ncbi:MAG TPA: sensor histidine kinase, partial [Cyanophyceae cyanobacterium]
WNENEQAAIERIARTLTIAYILDRRRVWVEQQLTQTKLLEAQRRDRLDDLLHQFRNPLTALRTFGKLLIKRLLPGDKNREAASSIVRETERLQELLQQFDACLDANPDELVPLTLPAATVIEASQPGTTTGGLPLLSGKALNLEAVSVADILEPLMVSAQAIAQERELDLQSDIPNNLPLVQGNAVALREVLSNLIDNALKYTPAGGHVDIRTGEQRQTSGGEQLGIAISDTGPGIPPEDLEHLFERHYRGVQASTAIPGSGLGLAIAKELIEQMHGEIEVFSPARLVWAKHRGDREDLVKGTTFIVWLSISGIELINRDEL